MKSIIVAIVIVAALIGGALIFSQSNSQTGNSVPADNVKVVNGQQIIELNAKGGYSPGRSVAKAGLPTILRIKTAGTFDCSSSIRIPSLKLGQILPSSGSTDFDLGTPAPGSLSGTCGMGMYYFAIDFQN